MSAGNGGAHGQRKDGWGVPFHCAGSLLSAGEDVGIGAGVREGAFDQIEIRRFSTTPFVQTLAKETEMDIVFQTEVGGGVESFPVLGFGLGIDADTNVVLGGKECLVFDKVRWPRARRSIKVGLESSGSKPRLGFVLGGRASANDGSERAVQA